jgi:hypothetical protein
LCTDLSKVFKEVITMKKTWNKPFLEELDINKTMAGPGLRYVDTEQNDPDEQDADHYS